MLIIPALRSDWRRRWPQRRKAWSSWSCGRWRWAGWLGYTPSRLSQEVSWDIEQFVIHMYLGSYLKNLNHKDFHLPRTTVTSMFLSSLCVMLVCLKKVYIFIHFEINEFLSELLKSCLSTLWNTGWDPLVPGTQDAEGRVEQTLQSCLRTQTPSRKTGCQTDTWEGWF